MKVLALMIIYLIRGKINTILSLKKKLSNPSLERERNVTSDKPHLISAILDPPFPMTQPIISLGTVISCVW